MDDILKNAVEVSQGFLGIPNGWPSFITNWLILLGILLTGLFISYKARKRILFNSWVNRYDPEDTELGKSIADLLLFKLRYIKRTHELSGSKLSLWNTFQDIPSFRQNLDKEIDFLGSVELGNYGKIVTGTFAFIFKILPLFIKPASLCGSINKYGEKKTILHMSLDNYSPKKWLKNESLLWEKECEELPKETIPDVVEEIACRIYIDLTGENLFKSWQCFMYFTQGLKSYLNYMDLKRQDDLIDAENHYMHALQFEENNPVVKYNLGVLKYYQYQDKFNDEAISCFRQALNCSEKNLRARASSAMANALGQKHVRYKTGKQDSLETIIEAMDYAQRSVELNRKLDSAYKSLAYTHHQYGEALSSTTNNNVDIITNYEEKSTKYRINAILYYQKTIELNKKHYVAHNNLANLYLEWAIQLKDQKISKSILRNIKLKIKEYITNKLIIDKSELLKKAIFHCEEALKINPVYHFSFDNLGNAFYELGNFNKAYMAYQNALVYDPMYAEAMNDQAMLFLVKEFEGFDENKATERHKEALELVKEEDNRKQKLVEVFEKRKSTLHISEIEFVFEVNQIKSAGI